MALLNNIHKLSKEYRIVLAATFIAAFLSYVLRQLPDWMATSLFWEFILTVVAISIIGLVAQFYYYSRKLAGK